VADAKRTTKRTKEGGSTTKADHPDPAANAEPPSVCPVAFCPICGAVSAMNRASPDVVQHLLVAGQQFLLAVQAVVDARAADFRDGDGDGRRGGSPMQRIDIG
jgi:hypothetical protein